MIHQYWQKEFGAEIVDHGVNGFLVRTETEWREAILTLLRDANLRHKMGAAGRRKVAQYYSLDVWGPRVARLLLNIASRNRAI